MSGLQRIGVSLFTLIAIVSIVLAGATIWLFVTNPVTVATGGDLDKNWIACDNTSTSPFYGNCYTEWDDHGTGNTIKMSTSSDGGLTWKPVPNP